MDSAYPNYEMCMKRRGTKLNNMLDSWKTFKHSFLDNGFYVTGGESPNDGKNSVYFMYEVKCLPDTIDLRK